MSGPTIIPEDYDPADGIVFTIQGQGIPPTGSFQMVAITPEQA